MKFRPIFGLIVIQILIVALLSLLIFNKLKIAKKISISTIKSSAILHIPGEKLHYYYEPVPNSVETINNNWEPHKAVYTINADGLNELRNYDSKKSNNTFRIIALGDSFTFGDGVSTKDNWTELLEAELNKRYRCNGIKSFEVINLGVRGYDTTYEVERYKRKGIAYHPDLVIWTFADLKRFKELMIPLSMKLKNMDREYIIKKEMEFYGDDISDNPFTENHLLSVANGLIAHSLSTKEIIDKQNILIDNFDTLYSNDLLYLEINNAKDSIVSGIFKDRVGKTKHFARYKFEQTDRLPDYHFSLKGHNKMMNNIIKTLKLENIIPCGSEVQFK